VCYFWENDIIFSNSQPRLGIRKINGNHKFSEIKVQKLQVLMLRDWILAIYLGKTYHVRKCKEIDIENVIIVALKHWVKGIQKPSKKKKHTATYNLEHLIFMGNSQTSTLPFWPCYRLVSLARSQSNNNNTEIFPYRSHSWLIISYYLTAGS